MSIRPTFRQLRRGVRRALSVAATPVRRRGYQKGIVVQPYRGYGTPKELFLKGRVFRQPRLGTRLDETKILRDIADIIRRIARLGLGRAELTARFGETVKQVTTDRDGYFVVELHPEQQPPRDRLWQEVELEVRYRGEVVRDVAEVFVPPGQARFVVISDIDDTVMHTGVANVAMMMYRLFVQSAESRTAFPGVAAFYRALHRGASSDENNPMLYVSRAPWSIYEVLDRFFNLHDIPHGPILFLREWGLTLQRPLPKRATTHKRDLIEDMLARYSDLPFILIGDSGQHDPEVYTQVVRDFPGRVLAVYIRNVSQSARSAEIQELAEEIERQGSSLVLADDTLLMAKHAAEHGFIAASDLDDVREEKLEEGAPPSVSQSGHSDADHLSDALDAQLLDESSSVRVGEDEYSR